MKQNYLEKLEFNKIQETLSTFSITYIGKELSQKIKPSNKIKEVKHNLEETQEAIKLIERNSNPPITEIDNIEIILKTLESKNTLQIISILSLVKILKISRELKDYINKDFIDEEDYPILYPLFTELYTNKNIIEKVDLCIINKDTIDDKASKQLESIRKKQKKLEQEIRNTLNKMLHSSSYSKYLQENVITIRNDRFVIPVKEEYRSQIKGFIHDISNVGSTIFIEPISVFEMNNEINQLKMDEQIEIEKILQELSQLFMPYTKELKKDNELIGTLDFIFAKGNFSKSINGTTPKINDNKQISLINARHPLIDKNKVVPISIELGKDFSTLLITGPNTGGKTVTLKTVGLLTCMACSGLNIPTKENSSIYVFDKIFTDIGDDQSISDSLSTFSSHITNIVEITKNVNSNSLVLIDELGSGTDPVEGANLAISILDFLKKQSCLTIVTTHYQELKHYALVTKQFENASVEFDINTLSPTYKLLVGIPGKSNAFEISKKLGLSESIIKNAKSLMSNEEVNLEELLKNIYDDKSTIEKEKIEIEKQLEQINLLRKSLERDNSLLKQQEKNLIMDAKLKARDILLKAKDEASSIIKEINDSTNSKKSNQLRNKLNDKIKELHIIDSDEIITTNNNLTSEDIKPNMEVYISSFKQNGIVLSHVNKSREVQVQIGTIKTKVNIKYLSLPNSITKNNKSNVDLPYSRISKTKNVKSEIKIIGLNVEEASFVVDKFLDDCSLAKLKTVRIVHGKGTGKLRDGIHKFLKTHKQVKSFRLGTYGEGEMGVTVVELK